GRRNAEVGMKSENRGRNTDDRRQRAEDREQKAEDGTQASNLQTPTSNIQNRVSSIQHPVPIIAMTAHAMAGDADKSLQAGMNGHVTKPIDPDQLFAALLKWIQPSEKRAHLQPPEVSAELPDTENPVVDEAQLPGTLAGFDLEAGLTRLQGNRRLYRKLLLDFGAKYSGVAGEIREALEAIDLKQAHILVHNLKGVAGNLAATNLLASAIEMEELLKNDDSKRTPSKKTLNRIFSKLETALNQALESVKTLQPLSIAGEENAELSMEAIITQAPEISKDEVEHLLRAAKKGDVEELIAIAEELQTRSDAYTPLSEKLIQLADNLDFEVIEELVSELA
ncbi:MAG: response regulator, partial [Deltaproteobacteria bacterium]|nr:response regulator [Deltaproteobacteria bacterium]